MDVFDKSYYRRVKWFLSLIGQWPFDNPTKRIVLIIIINIIIFTQIAAKVNNIILTFDDTDLLLDSLPPVIGNTVVVTKLFTYNAKMYELKKLLNYIRYDWSMLKTDKDLELLCMYAEQGRRYAKNYAYVLGFTMATFMISPVAPRLLGFGNTSTPRPLPHNVYYFVDNEDYYYPILFHAYLSVGVQMLFWIAADGMFIIFVQHACAMFSILKYKLENLVEDTTNLDIDINPSVKDDIYHSALLECIKRHTDVLSYAATMESLYSLAFYLQAGLNMIIMSITAVRASSSLDSPQEFFRQLSFSLAQLTHLVFECYQGQRLIDHSLFVEESLGNMAWYKTSIRTRKMICFMLMRSHIPSMLTAGKLFVISMEFCSVVLIITMSLRTIFNDVSPIPKYQYSNE